MVTPSYKEGFSTAATAISDTGSSVIVESLGNILTPEDRLPEGTGLFGHFYDITRGESGWQPVAIDAPASRFPNFELRSMSADFTSSLWLANVPGRSVADVYLDEPSGTVTYVGPGAPPHVVERALNLVGASPSLSHVLLSAHSPNGSLEEDQLWPGDPTLFGRRPSLYEYTGTSNAEPGLVGITANHKVPRVGEEPELVSDCGTALGGSFSTGNDAYNAISANGETVFFTAYACGESPPVNEVYERSRQEKTVDISEPVHPLTQGAGAEPEECDAACEGAAPQDAFFQGASSDGSKVFFLTAQPLLNGDKNAQTDLYEAGIEGEGGGTKVGRLFQISSDPNIGQAAEVQGVARVSEDGSHVYFVAKGVLTSEPDLSLREGRRVAIEGGDNLYVYERDGQYPSGHISFVATLSASDEADWRLRDARPVQATPDGRFVVFQSTADLTSDQEESTEAGQVFEYDAEMARLIRISHGESGYNNDGNSGEYAATIPIQNEELDYPSTRFTGLAVSADGARVFFSSDDALTARALNGAVNLYEYHNGRIALIFGEDTALINGESPPTELIGADESGEDAFFVTMDRLVPQDTDAQIDIYNVRIGGGPAPQATLASCSAGACHGTATGLPSPVTPYSESVMPEANAPVSSAISSSPKPTSGKARRTKHKHVAKKHKRRKSKRTTGKHR